MIVLGEPRRRDILNPTLRRLLGCEVTPMLVHANDSQSQKVLPVYFQTETARELGMRRLLISKRMNLSVAGGIEIVEDRGFQQHVLTNTDPEKLCWTELETTNFEDEKAEFNPQAGEKSGVFNTMVALSREVNGKQQKIFLVGDADLFDNENSASGCHVMHAVGVWLTDGEFPLFIPRPMAPVDKVSVSPSQFGIIKWVFSLVLPLLVLLGGCILWFRRKAR